MAMQNVRRDVRPEFAKRIDEGIARDCISVFGSQLSGSPVVAGAVRQRDALREVSTRRSEQLNTPETAMHQPPA
jgi:hypothetical protein